MKQAMPESQTESDLLIQGYRKYFRLWVNIARGVARSEDEAKDVVHNVISGILGDPSKKFESLAHVRNYVARAVINRAIQGRQRNDKSVELTEEHEIRLVNEPEALDGMRVKEEILALKGGISHLPKNDFEIIKLRFYAGLTFPEISALLNVPVSTLQSREEAALRRIRKWVRKKGF